LRKEYLADNTTPPRLVSTLSADYDVALPAAVTALNLPREVQLLDTLRPPAPGTLPTENVVRARGLTLQATPLAIDSGGNVLVRYRSWLGGVRLGPWETPLGFSVDSDPFRFGAVGRADTPYHASDGTPYIDLRTTLWIARPNGDQLKLYTPLEPRKKGAPMPQSLKLELVVEPSVRARNSEYTAFFRQPLTVTVPLPTQPDPHGIQSRLPPGQFPQGIPLAAAIAKERAREYYSENKRERAIYWMKSGLDVMAPFTDAAQEFRMELALLYNDVGDRRRAAQLYREVIAVQQRHPETHNRFAREARVALRTPAGRRPRF
jgi:hypothetical protein